jgi:hypothetical protein
LLFYYAEIATWVMFLTSANRRQLLGDDVITDWVDLDKPAFYMWSMAGFYSWNMMIAFMTIFKVRSRSKSGGCGCESGVIRGCRLGEDQWRSLSFV